MEITTQFVQAEPNATADNLVFEKLENLAKHYNWLIRAKVVFKEEKKSNGKGKICDVILSCPGPQIFASSNEETFEMAVAETIRDLEVQLRKRKAEMKPF
ncbi:HPF/RaiA family ribosome-associated protein [Flavobacterium degerlachei]|jgi:ribosomal subunit interface protein|uniref:Putative sigma-54 modulation protein n=1 Tax=Flavobacterium degerlachei TaxID=229203 RepID=A0A1H2UEQ6_9FLAO|nr:HPF/RaiA family ribosome-associated protein [Flavobacterium degerlachei]SDW54673.1 putative sigma-54 modulation protein [Flavobacterium degerlachei]